MNCWPFKKQMRSIKRRRQAGLSILELLISLSVMALMLSATAVAFDAAFKSYKINTDITTVSTASRNVTHQMCGTIRSAWNDPANDTIDVSADGMECSMVDASGRRITYFYNTNVKELQVNVNDAEQSYTLIENVDPISRGIPFFEAIDPLDDTLPAGTVGKVIIDFKIIGCKSTKVVSTSVVPRNVIYQ